MSDRSTDDPLEVFIDILRRAIAHHEVVLRVVRRTLSLLETSQSQEAEHFQNETNRVATLFADVCHGGTTRVRVSSTGVRIRNFFSLEENDLALITSPKTFAVARAGFKHMFHTAVEEEEDLTNRRTSRGRNSRRTTESKTFSSKAPSPGTSSTTSRASSCESCRKNFIIRRTSWAPPCVARTREAPTSG